LAQTGVPAEVQRFLAAEIESVAQLEVLLLLRAAADKEWEVEEIARALVTQRAAVATWLDKMAARGLLQHAGSTYRYSPPSAEVERTIDRLAESYATYRLAVVRAIFPPSGEGATRFSEAFRIRREDD
jgi:predicted transcriptional regulator